MAYIYIITNKQTNKSYIGKTMQSVKVRVHDHFTDSELSRNPNTKLSRAILKYGKDCWTYSVLDECSIDKLNEMEIYYINKYNTYYDGYNSTLGGDGQTRYEYDEEEIVHRYLNGESASRIAKTYGCNPSRISLILKSNKIDIRTSQSVKIVCFDRKHKPLQIFESKNSIAGYLASYGYTTSKGNVSHYVKDSCENGTRRFDRYWEYYNENKHTALEFVGRHEYRGELSRSERNRINKEMRDGVKQDKQTDCTCKYCGIKIRASATKDICYNCEIAIQNGIPPKPSKEEFLKLYKKYSLADIARMFGRNSSTIAYWRKQYLG